MRQVGDDDSGKMTVAGKYANSEVCNSLHCCQWNTQGVLTPTLKALEVWRWSALLCAAPFYHSVRVFDLTHVAFNLSQVER